MLYLPANSADSEPSHTSKKDVFARADNGFNPFLLFPILYPLKARANQRFSGVSRGYKMGIFPRNGLS